jgi:branched-chain amino acid transport system permease protein
MKLGKILSYAALVIVIFLIPIFLTSSEYYLHVFILCGINVILAISLRAITTTGQISLGHAGFMSIGAYTSAVLAMKFGVPVYGALILGAIVAMAVAAIIAFPITRVRTVYLAMLTLFFGELISLIFTEWRGMTEGTSGLMGIPPLDTISIPGLITIEFMTKLPYSYFVLVLALITILFLYGIERSYIGMTFKSIAQDESLAASIGTNIANHKAIIFCIGCFFAGLAGSFYAHYNAVLTPDTFGLFPSLYIMVYVIVGGGKKFAGAIIGAIVLTIVPEAFRVVKEYQPFVFVAVLFIVIFLLRGGLVILPDVVKAQIRKIYRRKAENA